MRTRVFTLPRTGRIVKSGRRRNNWAWRRKEAVPTLAPCGKAARLVAFIDNNASRGSSRGSTHAIASPAGSQVSKSFKECTARSICPAINASYSRPHSGALALECRAADEALRQLLEPLHDPRSAACVDLLGEQALAADLGEQPVLHPVAGRADRHDLDRSVRGEFGVSCNQTIANEGCLVQRHRAAAGSDPEMAGRH